MVIESAPFPVERSGFMRGLWAGRLEAVTVACGGVVLYNLVRREDEAHPVNYEAEQEETHFVNYEAELSATRELMRELEAEVMADPLVAAIECPADGTYTGETAEDDGGDQEASTTLQFSMQGAVAGAGFDSEDGAYQIRKGRWSAKRVAWIEEYEEGFKVALRGQLLPDGSIRGMWASSRGIGGAVTLAPP